MTDPGFLPGSHPRAAAWLAARGRQGSVQPGWRPCAHAPTAWVTEPATRRLVQSSGGLLREVAQEGATYCQACSGEHADLVLRWLAHGPVTAWTLATDLGWTARAAVRVLGVLRDAGLVVAERDEGELARGEPFVWRRA